MRTTPLRRSPSFSTRRVGSLDVAKKGTREVGGSMSDDISARKMQSWQAFLRDLPRLYKERPEQWVAYRGEAIIDFGAHSNLLHQECLARGLQEGDFFIFGIVPEEREIHLGLGGFIEEAPPEPSTIPTSDLERRITELDADPNNVLTWAEIKAHIKRER
jgi:hypothetical protein